METCDVCRVEFPHATPNVAVADAKVKGLGLWAFLCKAHLSLGLRGTVHSLPEPEEAEA